MFEYYGHILAVVFAVDSREPRQSYVLFALWFKVPVNNFFFQSSQDGALNF